MIGSSREASAAGAAGDGVAVNSTARGPSTKVKSQPFAGNAGGGRIADRYGEPRHVSRLRQRHFRPAGRSFVQPFDKQVGCLEGYILAAQPESKSRICTPGGHIGRDELDTRDGRGLRNTRAGFADQPRLRRWRSGPGR